MQKNIRLVALDMDGTLFDHNSNITEMDQKAVKAATDTGVTVVISTGRPYSGLPIELLSSLGIRYAITTNGSAVYRIPEKECIFSSNMTPQIVVPIIKRILEKDVYFDVYVGGNAYSQHSMAPLIDDLLISDSVKAYVKKSRIFVDDLVSFVEDREIDAQKVTVNFCRNEDGTIRDRDSVKAILAEYPQITYLSGGFYNLEFTKAGTTKAMGLRFLAEHLGIDMSQTMACGDSPNDLDIIQTAAIGVAMDNADPRVKEAADFITLSNEEGGVAHAIYEFVI